MRFRGDINGLRAIAVAAVVLFHFGITGAQGGYIGVDVFFVISGYLMTAIIYGRLEKHAFSVLGFYRDRAQRIIPALAFLCLALLLVGWLLLLPDNYALLAEHILASMGFVSNLFYWKEAGYFEPASHDNWLLHTWSLSVEFQFYLIYPLLILLLRRWLPQSSTRWLLAAAALASLALSAYASSRWPTSAFFLLPTRMWELLAGGLVFLFPFAFSREASRWLELGGIALIVLSVVIFTEETFWPGWLALIPVAGTMMVIYSARHESLITGNPAAQFLGKISYSVYLWHWPIAVWIYFFGLEREPGWVAAGMVASLCCGWLSYTYVENFGGTQKRSALARTRHRLPVPIAASVLGIGLLAAITTTSQGYPGRITDEFRDATAELVHPRKMHGWCFHSVGEAGNEAVDVEKVRCPLGARDGQTEALLFGDSFAGHYGPFWDIVGQGSGVKVSSVASDWCYPSVLEAFTGYTSGPEYEQCMINRRYLQEHVGNYDMVIFAGQWRAVYDLDQMEGLLQAIHLAADRAELVVLMAAPTNFDINVKNMYERSLKFGHSFDITRFAKTRDLSMRAANEQLAELADQYPNVMFFTRDSMFHIDGVPSDVTAENVPFSLDETGHISVYGSKKAAEAFLQTPLYQEFTRLVDARFQGGSG
ncbi:acyltransferase family protein [Pseudomonas sp.]|uniref:acyltransferase family protein n=1 Tax=Pseudomonas sp. TaxID=306 RepID=UPI0027295A69|nr:acyltransferase family protein [Pseudomonas sp.]